MLPFDPDEHEDALNALASDIAACITRHMARFQDRGVCTGDDERHLPDVAVLIGKAASPDPWLMPLIFCAADDTVGLTIARRMADMLDVDPSDLTRHTTTDVLDKQRAANRN